MPHEGESDLAKPHSIGPIRDAVKAKGKLFFEVPDGMDIKALYEKLDALKADQLKLNLSMESLKKGEDTSIPLISQVKGLGLDVKDTAEGLLMTLKNLGNRDCFTKEYNNDLHIAIDTTKLITVGMATQPQAPSEGMVAEGGAQSNAQQVGSVGPFRRMLQGRKLGLATVVGSGLPTTTQPTTTPSQTTTPTQTQSGSGTTGGTSSGQITSTRNPFKDSMYTLLKDKAIFCQIGIISRRFDVLNQQIGGLETKIPDSATLNNMKDSLSKFMDIYDTISVDFSYATPSQWFEAVEKARKLVDQQQQSIKNDRYSIDQLISSYQGISSRLSNLETGLDTTVADKIKAYLANYSLPDSTWDSKVGSRILAFDYTKLKDKSSWNSALDSFVTDHDLPGWGMSLKEKIDGIDIGGNVSTALDNLGIPGDLSKVKTFMSSINTDLINIKKKFNDLSDTAGDKLGSIKTRATSLKDSIGSTDSLGLRGKLQGIKDSLDNIMDGTPIAIRCYGYASTGSGSWTLYTHMETADKEADLPKDYTLSNGKMVGLSGTGKYGFYRTRTYTRLLDATADVKSFTELIVGDGENKAQQDGLTMTSVSMYAGVAQELTEAIRKFTTAKLKASGSDKVTEAKTTLKGLIPGLDGITTDSGITLPGKFTSGELASKLPGTFSTMFWKVV